MHAGIAGQRSCRGQVVAAQHCGDDSITIHFSDHSPVHKVDQTVSIYCNPCKTQRQRTHTNTLLNVQLFINTSTPGFKGENKSEVILLWSQDAATADNTKRQSQ